MKIRSIELSLLACIYKTLDVHFRFQSNEFRAPQHLKDDVESAIRQLLSQPLSTKIFKSVPMLSKIAEKEEQYV